MAVSSCANPYSLFKLTHYPEITDKQWTIVDLVQLLEDEERKVANGGRINGTDRT